LYVIDPEPNPASSPGPVPTLPAVYSDLNPALTYEPVLALPPVQRVFTSVFSIGNPSGVGGQSNAPEVTPNSLPANTQSIPKPRPTAKGQQKVPEHVFDNAGDDNLEITERDSRPALARPRPKPQPTGKGKKVQEHASDNAGHILETPRPECQTLTFDPAHQWESNYDLGPSLDPGFNNPSTSNTTELLTPWLTLLMPAKSPRRKADMLAIDEAQSLMAEGKRRW
jgi:hypothetical protein